MTISLNYKNFFIGVFISAVLAAILFSLSAHLGKINSFLLLNANLGICADYFFAIITNAGDGVMWLIVLAIIFLMKRKDLFLLIIPAFVFTTIFTAVCKYLILPLELRPWKAIANQSLFHHVWFVELLSVGSFPSGHSATAFTYYLLFCLIIKKNWWLYTGLIYAVTVSYSRIYLAQHFPLDVAGGIASAITSLFCSLFILRISKKIS